MTSPDCNSWTPKHERLEGVALTILEDAAQSPWRRDIKYSPRAAIEKVVVRRQSIASCGRTPSYLWCSIDLDEDGEPTPMIDTGCMPLSVCIAGKRRLHRYNTPAYEIADIGPWQLLTGDSMFEYKGRHWEFTYRTGIPIGVAFLTRVTVEWSTDSYSGESDCDISSTLLYVDPPPRFPHLPLIVGPLKRALRAPNRNPGWRVE